MICTILFSTSLPRVITSVPIITFPQVNHIYLPYRYEQLLYSGTLHSALIYLRPLLVGDVAEVVQSVRRIWMFGNAPE